MPNNFTNFYIEKFNRRKDIPLILNIDVIAFVNLAYPPLQWLIFPVALSIWSPSVKIAENHEYM